ncbi:hypothetical protein BpHYR1_032165 [Brachionus plicatilis]|uniref:Uncharacterized protein n=1 Tax=Brachionus plicatilis TaxID=10195 RepID=A0A3M7Q9D4_BRAPC|nr:hypothetical protein BpHYR1_032165 [Brachionus plicatilis]
MVIQSEPNKLLVLHSENSISKKETQDVLLTKIVFEVGRVQNFLRSVDDMTDSCFFDTVRTRASTVQKLQIICERLL